jgi:outer membrane protein assembly factor BamB
LTSQKNNQNSLLNPIVGVFQRFPLIVLCLLVLGLSACSTNPSKKTDAALAKKAAEQRKKDKKKAKKEAEKALQPKELTAIDKKMRFRPVFADSLGKLSKYYHQFHFAMDGDWIYAASQNGTVVKLDKQTGKETFRVNLKRPLTAGLAVDSEGIYVGNLDGELVSLNKTDGSERWRKQLSSEVVSPPAVDGLNVIVQTNDGAVVNLNPQTGEQRWRQDTQIPALTLRGASSGAIFGPFVAVGAANGILAIFDLKTGQKRWADRVAVPTGDTEIERLVDVDSTPVVQGNLLIAVSYQGNLTAYNITSGLKAWSQPASSYKDLAVNGDKVFVSQSDGKIIAFNSNSGQKAWEQSGLERRKPSAVAVSENALFVTDYAGILHALDPNTGQFIGRKSLTLPDRPIPGHNKTIQVKRLMKPNPPIRVQSLVDKNTLYVFANNGQLQALSFEPINKKAK